MYGWRITAVVLACAAVCLSEDATESSVSSPVPSAVTTPSAATGSSADNSTTGAATTGAGDTSSSSSDEDATTSAVPVSTSPPSDVTGSNSTAVGESGASTTAGGTEDGSAAAEVTTAGEPETTVAPSSAAATVGSSPSAAETTTGTVTAMSADESAEVATTAATSITEAATTAASSPAASAETAAEASEVQSSETTLAPSTEVPAAASPVPTTVTAEAAETAEIAETTATTEAQATESSQGPSSPTPETPAATSVEVTPPEAEATSAGVTSPEVTSSVVQSPSPSPAAEEPSSAETESAAQTSPADPTEQAISTTEAIKQTTTPPMEYYGYPRSMTMEEMGIPEVEAAVTMVLSPRHISFLAWLGMKENLLRSAILNFTRDNGFSGSELEWVYIAPSPTYRPPHVLLSFLITWRGGEPTENTVTPAAPALTSSGSGDGAGAGTSPAPATPSATPATSDPAASRSSRRRRAIAGDRSGLVPAELLMKIITDNAEHIGNMVLADLESTSAGPEAAPACSKQEASFMATNGHILLALSVAAGICLCLTCGALLYVRLIRDSGHWEPQPAYHEGERVGGLDLHSDTDCKKGEEPLDNAGGEVYPLSSIPNTPRGSLRGAAKVRDRGDPKV